MDDVEYGIFKVRNEKFHFLYANLFKGKIDKNFLSKNMYMKFKEILLTFILS